MTDTIKAQPYEARRCPICNTWIYTAGGPFSEDDPTKTYADYDHLHTEHPEVIQGAGNGSVGFPFFSYNDEPVDAVPPRPLHRYTITVPPVTVLAVDEASATAIYREAQDQGELAPTITEGSP